MTDDLTKVYEQFVADSRSDGLRLGTCQITTANMPVRTWMAGQVAAGLVANMTAVAGITEQAKPGEREAALAVAIVSLADHILAALETA